MSGVIYALLATLFAGIGGRDQMLVAALTKAQGARIGLLVTALASGALACAFAGWAALEMAHELVRNARLLLACFALAAAGGESLLLAPRRSPQEPTHSLGAAGIVLLAQQLTDAARFLVYAVAMANQSPLAAAIGGAVGGGMAIALGWMEPEVLLGAQARLRHAQRLAGTGLLIAAAIMGLHAFSAL